MMKTLLVGCGGMAVEHFKVLRAFDIEPIVVGRSAVSAERFSNLTGWEVASLDLNTYLASGEIPQCAVVAVNVESLSSVCLKLIHMGFKKILLEKPGAMSRTEIEELRSAATEAGTKVYVAYNRRFYNAVSIARKMIANDGGPCSYHFDFTEWSHQIKDLDRSPEQKERWLLANSTHVIDLAFHLGGFPSNLDPSVMGTIDWHPSAAVFAGHGRCETGALFSYHANWIGPGRWMLEVITDHHKLIFCPMEELQIMKKGSVVITKVDPSDDLDVRFKPGLYRQTEFFLKGEDEDLCSLEEQARNWALYERIAGY